MELKISSRLKSSAVKPKNDSKVRLKKAISLIREPDSRDAVFFNEANDVCIIKLHRVAFISYNDLLRLDNRSIYPFKMAWHKRISGLFETVDMTKWIERNEEEKVVEFIYKTKNAQTYDADAIVSAFKSALDGLVEVKVLNDDNQSNLPLIIPRQEKAKGENSLFIVISSAGDIRRYYSDAFKKVIDDIIWKLYLIK